MPTMILLIVGINIAYVSLFTLRLILVIKGFRLAASLLSMVEVFIYLMGLTIVLDNLDDPLNLIAYCIGWGVGVYFGSVIEEKLALGYVLFEVVIDEIDFTVPQQIREAGYGVTSWLADGRDGKRIVMKVLTKRKKESELYRLITFLQPKAFIISYEPNHFQGGFLVKGMKKQATTM